MKLIQYAISRDRPNEINRRYVMPGLVPSIHVLLRITKDVDGQAKPGHDVVVICQYSLGGWIGGIFTFLSRNSLV
jgi:hypothetical protein